MKAHKGARRKPRVSSSVPSGFLLVTPHFMLERPFGLHETAAPPHPVPHHYLLVDRLLVIGSALNKHWLVIG